MSFDPEWANHFSDPAWVAIELYARVVSPLQLIVEFQDLPYIPFGQQQPREALIRSTNYFVLGAKKKSGLWLSEQACWQFQKVPTRKI